MTKAAKRPAKAALERADKIGQSQAAGSAGRTIAATRQDARSAKAAVRREAILEAALDEFSARGFAAARLDDVAKRAGVAKGTIYLYFTDKETLFQELIRAKMVPVVGSLELAFATDLPLRAIVDQVVELFVREVFDTRRKEVIRLIISEGPRFPTLAEFYYREVLSRLLMALRGCCAARSSAASLPATRWCAFRNCSARRASSPSSGADCSTASSRSTCAP